MEKKPSKSFFLFLLHRKGFIWHTICKKKRKKKMFGMAFQSPIVKTTEGEENGKNYCF